MKVVKLGDICSIINGGTPKTGIAEYWDGDILWITPKDLGKVTEPETSHTERKLTQSGVDNSSAKVVPIKSVILSTRAPIGHVVINAKPMAFNQGCRGLVPGNKILAEYLYYFLKLSREKLNELGTGTTFRELSTGALKDVEIPLLSLEEQRRVVERLDAAFEKIDRAIELTEKNIKNTQTLYQRFCVEIFRNVIGKECSLGDVCTIDTKLVDPRRKPYSDYLHVGGANIESEIGRLIKLKTAEQEKLISSKFPFDDTVILYSKIRPYLKKVARPDFTGLCSADVYPLSPANELRKDYLYYLLLSNDFTQYAISGSDRAGMPKVNRPHLFAYEFTLPSVSDQDEIIKKLDDISAKSSSLATKYQSKVSMLRALKQSLLTQAFSQSEVE